VARVYLISGNTTSIPYPVYPLGLSLIAGALRKAGHECRFRDLFFSGGDPEALVRDAVDFTPDAVGMSLRNFDNVSWPKTDSYISGYTAVVSELKKHLDVPVILGGSAFTLFPERILDVTGADYGVAGEGEGAVLQCMEDILAGKNPESRIYRGKGYLAPEDIGSFRREPELAEFYLTEGGMLNIQAKRGCPHSCVYCSYPVLEGRCYRARSPKDIADELEYLAGHYGMDFFMFTDSVFNDDEGTFLEIAEEMVRRSLAIPWTCYMRPAVFNGDEVEILKKSGLHSVEWGTDACTDTTLRAMGKGFTFDEVRASNNLFQRKGIYGSHFIIFGGAGETEETVREGLENLSSLENCVVFGGIGIRIFPDTPIVKIAEKQGVITPETDLFEPVFYISPGVRSGWLDETLRRAFKDRTDRVYPGDGMAEKVAAMHKLGIRGPVWEYLLPERMNRRRRKRSV
jgi:radical SAM superfamily enzyme YgiQ (UPF0313 family)